MGELVKGLEEPSRRRGAADAIALFCRAAKFDFQEHLGALLSVSTPPLASDLSALLEMVRVAEQLSILCRSTIVAQGPICFVSMHHLSATFHTI